MTGPFSTANKAFVSPSVYRLPFSKAISLAGSINVITNPEGPLLQIYVLMVSTANIIPDDFYRHCNCTVWYRLDLVQNFFVLRDPCILGRYLGV